MFAWDVALNSNHIFLPAAVTLVALSAYAQTSAPAVTSERAAARFLDQATWGPTPSSITQLQQMGFTNWLSAQFALKTCVAFAVCRCVGMAADDRGGPVAGLHQQRGHFD